MRCFHVTDGVFAELPVPPQALPARGFVWLAAARPEFAAREAELQAWLAASTGTTLLDLHVSDLLNPQIPSQFDYTAEYDLMLFRRLASTAVDGPPTAARTHGFAYRRRPATATADAAEADASFGPAPGAVLGVHTLAVGFAVFGRVLLTVHPADCPVREYFALRLSQANVATGSEARAANVRLPASPDDLMLRMLNFMVDGYLDLRRRLTRELATLQHEMMQPRLRRIEWNELLEVRNALTLLEDIGEDQESAVQEWLDALAEWPAPADAAAVRERELLRVRARDVAEHIERVINHVRRLEASVESAVQMHFSAVGQRTNAIMRTLTVITAIFLPLNLITGFFGMNFEFLPFIHAQRAVWATIGLMALLAVGLGAYFWRKRYIASDS